MQQPKKQLPKGQVKFIRVNGRVVPIRADKYKGGNKPPTGKKRGLASSKNRDMLIRSKKNPNRALLIKKGTMQRIGKKEKSGRNFGATVGAVAGTALGGLLMGKANRAFGAVTGLGFGAVLGMGFGRSVGRKKGIRQETKKGNLVLLQKRKQSKGSSVR